MTSIDASLPTGRETTAQLQENDALAFRPGRAWSMVAILALMILLSFIDRYALTVLVGPIKHDLQLTDTQIGLLLGTAFGVFYSCVGLPLGYLVDNYNRRNLLIAGVAIWSSMTVLSGIAHNFTVLFIGRMGVGFGEAVLTPAAYSLIKDAFPENLRSRAYGVYVFGSSVGIGASLVVAGGLAHLFDGANSSHFSVLSGLSTWQYVLLVIGAAGFPIAALGLLIREPIRRDSEAGESPRIADVLRHVRLNRRIYFPLLAVYAIWGICVYSYGAWLPTAIGRTWQVPATVVGPKYGFVTMCLAPLAAVLFSLFFDRLVQARRASRIPMYAGVACLVVAVPTAIGPLALWPAPTWICLGISTFFSMGVQLALIVVLAQIAPGRMIGKMSAACFLCLNLVGLGLGPSLVASIAGIIGDKASAIGQALSMTVGAGWFSVGILFVWVWLGLRRQRSPRAGDAYTPCAHERDAAHS
ncbi:putative MFS family arabinose efflux permease [Paraburkholderia sp. BL23I1N1]|uniref:MFS transporter n=1 Tax=Paraburkholderia sp. BL23I1N1 TaxID=1938802 RepID=UPI000E74E891|nr:MFS transporter [Paraburkholderia sp. BL23I1N1]RKE36428.1 putative MFS family arabinose efflux permease [Paraburkholderia sp. BL23I1N1]